ncbi:pyridoxamine 5'-phosphate oxidase family protein [Streptomyces sp. XM4193]|uniref:pyridoxamine 5'-phosphate oxidase family protein n=1 Tax=Streptomyces sp. XM4193 TaxID=2929782 RepID=UPI001FF7C8FC|nr:pyridoxamine 5'-phosphate oxidase family protein [Streptomyces sp. XM4193]MCK1796737.1 pyridoxamine 5'-phosphate oxidase family protein [Streptomyces sp. XM4193]
MALSREEREEFLAEAQVGSLGVAAGAERGPLVVPIWYAYEPGGEVWVVTEADSRKARLIADAGRFTMLAERTAPTVRYVSVEGPVVEQRPATDEEHRRMVRRFLPGEAGEQYLAMTEEMFGELQYISMRPQRWLSSDMGSF